MPKRDDDDVRVLRAVAADLRTRYAAGYRIVRADNRARARHRRRIVTDASGGDLTVDSRPGRTVFGVSLPPVAPAPT